MYKNIIATVMLAIAATNGFAQSTIISNTLPVAVRNKMDLPLLCKYNNISIASGKISCRKMWQVLTTYLQLFSAKIMMIK